MTTVNDVRGDMAGAEAETTFRRLFLAVPHLGSAERKLTLIIVDLALLCGALIAAVTLRTTLLPNLSAVLGYVKWYITLAVVWFFVSTVFAAYDLVRAVNRTAGPLTAAGAAAITSLIYLFIPWLTPPLENRSQAFLFGLLATVGVASWRLVYARLFARPVFQHNALFVGPGHTGQLLARTLQARAHSQDGNPLEGAGHTLVGIVDDEALGQVGTAMGLPVLGGSTHLVRLARTHYVDEIIVSPPADGKMSDGLFEAILDCHELGFPVKNIVTLYEELTGRVAVEYASYNIEAAICCKDNPFIRFYRLTKRLVDLSGGLVGLLGVAFLSVPVLVVNAVTSPGPLFYKQQRVGWGGRPLTVIKFRSMVPNAEKQMGAVWAATDDPRVTPAGRWLRRTHMDELPQVINVLRGEMSIVGPRPERPEFVGELTRRMPLYRARHRVRPGITGWAQIHQDYGDSVEATHDKLEYDLFYVKYAGLVLDGLIILRTIAMVLGLRGR